MKTAQRTRRQTSKLGTLYRVRSQKEVIDLEKLLIGNEQSHFRPLKGKVFNSMAHHLESRTVLLREN